MSCKTWKDLWLRGCFFSLTGSVSVGLGNRCPLIHSTSVLSAQITSQSLSPWPVSARRSLSPQRHTFRGSCSPPRAGLMVFRGRGCNSLLRTWDSVQDSGLQEPPSQALIATATLVTAFCDGVGPACACILEIFSGCNGLQHRWVLFLSSVQCHREPFVSNTVNRTENQFPNLNTKSLVLHPVHVKHPLFYEYHRVP